MLKGDMAMRKLIIPIQFIMVMGCLAFNGYATNSLGMEFVLIKPGKFMMGSPEDESGRYTGEGLHSVNLTNPFYLQTTEVTQAQWKALMGKNPASHKGCGGTCPVEQVSWKDAQQFIQKLNQKEGTHKYRLPTEAEWEYACNLDPIGWYCGNSNNRIQPVGGKKPNAWGLYDMHGNVQEWCQDWFGTYPDDEVINPKGPKKGSYRAMRGGVWYSPARDCRSASRFGSPPHYRFQHIGFRLCMTP
jgi:formylglycine-generating enzyme required for sulfatase activity